MARVKRQPSRGVAGKSRKSTQAAKEKPTDNRRKSMGEKDKQLGEGGKKKKCAHPALVLPGSPRPNTIKQVCSKLRENTACQRNIHIQNQAFSPRNEGAVGNPCTAAHQQPAHKAFALPTGCSRALRGVHNWTIPLDC